MSALALMSHSCRSVLRHLEIRFTHISGVVQNPSEPLVTQNLLICFTVTELQKLLREFAENRLELRDLRNCR